MIICSVRHLKWLELISLNHVVCIGTTHDTWHMTDVLIPPVTTIFWSLSKTKRHLLSFSFNLRVDVCRSSKPSLESATASSSSSSSSSSSLSSLYRVNSHLKKVTLFHFLSAHTSGSREGPQISEVESRVVYSESSFHTTRDLQRKLCLMQPHHVI